MEKWVALVANAANQANIYVYSLDELSREPRFAKQLTVHFRFQNWAQFSPDNKEIFFIENGRIGVVNLEGRSRSLAVTAEMDVDFSREKMEVFRQGWSVPARLLLRLLTITAQTGKRCALSTSR
jgi:hypothetical protein